MKMTKNTELSLDELAAEAVRLGRELEQAAQAASLGGSNRDVGHAGLTLRRLAERDPFDPRDEASLAALKTIIQMDLKSEISGYERRFIDTHYDDLGQHGEVRDCPIYSERGDQLLTLQGIYFRFMKARAATLDRAAGERTITRLLSV